MQMGKDASRKLCRWFTTRVDCTVEANLEDLWWVVGSAAWAGFFMAWGLDHGGFWHGFFLAFAVCVPVARTLVRRERKA